MGGNYGNGLFKQLQETMLKLDGLSAEISVLKGETKYLRTENKVLLNRTEKLSAEVLALEETTEALNTENAALRKENETLKVEVDRLRKQLNNDSGNSSKPPSTDVKPNAPNTYNGRTKTGKKPGGQKGRKGKHLSRAVIENKIAEGKIRHAVVEHGTPAGSYISKYVIDIKLETVAMEHRFYGDANIPAELRPDVQYGVGVKAFVAALSGQGLVSSNRITDMLAAWTDGALELSDGTVYNFLTEFNAKAAAFVENTKTKLLNSPVLNVDETGARVNGRNMFFRNYSDEKRVLYTANRTKGKAAIADDDILPRYAGTLIHDHNTVNYNYGTGNGECNVHIIRYLRACSDNTRHHWPDDMIEFLLSLKRSKEAAFAFGAEKFASADLDEYRRRYDAIVAAGFEVLKETKSRFYQKEEEKLLNRLKKYRDNHLLFAENFAVPFDNNLSERDLRMVKTKQKVSGCFRSLDGAKTFANLMSVIKTAIKQNISPYIAIRSIFDGEVRLS